MKKFGKYVYAVLLLLNIIACLFLFAACEDKESDGKQEETAIEPATLIGVDGGEIKNDKVFMRVEESADSISLSDKIKCSGDSVWKLYFDKLGQTEIPTKIATGKSGELESGDNIFYIVVSSQDSTKTNLYELTVHRSYSVNITFYNGDKFLKTDKVIDGSAYVIEFEPMILGYEFSDWRTENGAVAEESFQAIEDIEFYANTTVREEMKHFEFEATEDTCVITELKDKDLAEIVIPAYVTDFKSIGQSVGRGVFFGCDSLTIYCEAERQSVYWGYWNGYDDSFYQTCPTVWNCKYNDKDEEGYAYSIIDGIRYSLKDGIATVIKQPANISGNIVIPSEVVYKGEAYSVTSIGDEAFGPRIWGIAPCITGIVLPSSVERIGYLSFYGSGLINIELGSGLKSIGDGAFQYCGNLTSMEIPSGVQSIGGWAFESCHKLTSIKISSSVTSIGDYAFYNCISLSNIEIPSSVTSIGNLAFYNCNNLIIYCEAAVQPSGWENTWYGARPVIWDCENNDKDKDGYAYSIINGVRYSLKDGEATVVRQPTNIFGNIVIPSSVIYKSETYSVTSIGDYAFFDCSSLASIEIPSGVTSIGSSAFYGCSSLASIEIPSGVTSIGSSAFYGCSSLTSIEIPSSVTSIGSSAFSGCNSLTSIEIPSSVTSIGSSAFSGCRCLIIYCESESQPSGWSSDWGNKWNPDNRPVVWGVDI